MLAHLDHGGDGPALVLLHAFPLDSRMWHRVSPLLNESLRVVTLDLPGLGHSGVPSVPPSMEEVARQVLAVLDHLGLDDAHVFGISTGGYAALEIARTAPHRLRSLVLASTSTRLVPPDNPADRLRTAEEVDAAGTTQPVAGSADEGLGATAHRRDPLLREELLEIIADADPAGVSWLACAIAIRHDTSAALAAYAGQVLLLYGAEDTATPPSYADELRRVRERAGRGEATTTTVLGRTGHLTALEAPREVADAVLGFVSRAESARRARSADQHPVR